MLLIKGYYIKGLLYKRATIAQCLAAYLGDSGKFSIVFFVLFQASTGKKLQEKITEKITGPRNLMLNIPLVNLDLSFNV